MQVWSAGSHERMCEGVRRSQKSSPVGSQSPCRRNAIGTGDKGTLTKRNCRDVRAGSSETTVRLLSSCARRLTVKQVPFAGIIFGEPHPPRARTLHLLRAVQGASVSRRLLRKAWAAQHKSRLNVPRRQVMPPQHPVFQERTVKPLSLRQRLMEVAAKIAPRLSQQTGHRRRIKPGAVGSGRGWLL